MGEKFNVPEPFKSISERGSQQDRRYFRNHPNETVYHRRVAKGEIWPWQTPQGAVMRVQQFAPGMRGRELINCPMDQLVPYPGCEALCVEMANNMGNVSADKLEKVRQSFKNDAD